MSCTNNTTGAKEHVQFTCTMYSAYIQVIIITMYLFWVLVDMINDFLYQRNNNQLL